MKNPLKSPNIQQLQQSLAPQRQAIATHPLFARLAAPAFLQFWMSQHVFAVWDFVSLIKTVYARLTANSTLWHPPTDPDSVRLLTEILLTEETDETPLPGAEYGSHFNLYCAAMQECGANLAPINHCLTQVRLGNTLEAALTHPDVLPSTRKFVQQTFASFTQPTHQIAASLVFGREGMLPVLFTAWLTQLDLCPLPCRLLRLYLERHIHLDAEAHFPKAARMLINLCATKADWVDVENAAQAALQARLDFLNGVEQAIICHAD